MIVINIFLIILAILLLIILWILLVPFVLYINTEQRIYYLRLVTIAKAQFFFNESIFYIRIRLLFMSFKIDPLELSKKKKKEKEKKTYKWTQGQDGYSRTRLGST